MSNKKHHEYMDMADWYGGNFNANKFDVKKVKFHNAKIRLKNMLAEFE